MANSSSTSPEITSRCVTVREHTGTLNLEVTDYLGLVGIGVGEPLTSSVLEVGGYKWMISFYPDGVENFHGHAAAFVHCYFDSKDADVTAKFTLSILEKRSQLPTVPSLLSSQLESMLEDGRGADVTFLVGSQEFRGHRSFLAARSPVFGAQFYGPMAEKDDMPRVKVIDVEPDIFQMMLHYIYKDSPPRCTRPRHG
uniref:Speckle-type POZ protein-like protein B n=1 Tax=Aegilops tauschii TaxID=37682 RepID=N1QSM8_AEGTA